jgi:nitrogen fixation NifU-like protein
MSELNDLYQEVILDHNKRPRNYGRAADTDRHAEGYNPLCGDHLTVFLRVEDDVLRAVRFEGSGCAVSKASASMMTEALTGRTAEEAAGFFERFHRLVTGCPDIGHKGPDLGKLEVFSGVSAFPMRVKCATLAWHTLRAALEGRREAVSTE